MKKIAIAALFILMASGCLAKENAPRFEELIGSRYSTSKQLLVFGITGSSSYEQRVDYYVVTESPGISGPEVVTRDVLEPGSKIEIKKVGPCQRCPQNDRRLVINVLSTNRYASHEVVLSDIGEPTFFKVDQNKVSMNPSLFVKKP